MAHIIDRAIYHFCWDGVWFGVFLGLLTYWMLRNRKACDWFMDPFRLRLTIAALVVSTVMPLREAYDVMFKTQSNLKTPFDQIGHLIFPGFWAWVAYRVWKFIKTRRPK